MKRQRSISESSDFYDTRTTEKRKRKNESSSIYEKGWSGARTPEVPCPIIKNKKCILRVTPHSRIQSPKSSERLIRHLEEELQMSNTLSLLNIGPSLEQGEVFSNTHQLATIVEKYDTDLKQFMHSTRSENWLSIANLSIELIFKTARAGIFHGDIKPENIVLSKNRDSGEIKVRLIDFDIKYMSTFSKDEDILRDYFENNHSQLCSLYAVSMVALLFYHFYKVKVGETDHELTNYFFEFLKNFALFIPPQNMKMEESKFGKVLVRHLRHYHLMDKQITKKHIHRNGLLNFFWSQLVKQCGVTRQENAKHVPTLSGLSEHFTIDKRNIFSPEITSKIPPLSSEFKRRVKLITTDEENKRLEEIEEKQNKYIQIVKNRIMMDINLSDDRRKKIKEIHATLIEEEPLMRKEGLNLEKINALMRKIKDHFRIGDVIEIPSDNSIIDSGGSTDSSDSIFELPLTISRQKSTDRTCGYHAIQNLLLQIVHKKVFTKKQFNTICSSAKFTECTIPTMIYLLGGKEAALPDCLKEIGMKNIKKIRDNFTKDFEVIELKPKESVIGTENFVVKSIHSPKTRGLVLLIQGHYFALVKIYNDTYQRVDSLPNVAVKNYIAQDVAEIILKEMKSKPNIFSFGILLQEKKGKIDNLPPIGSLIQNLERKPPGSDDAHVPGG